MPNIRRANVADVEALTRLRLALCAELEGNAAQAVHAELEGATRAYLAERLASGEFMAWLAIADRAIVSMSGLLFFQRPPSASNLGGLDAYIMNMYTLPAWRGQGLATALLRETIAFVRASDARRIWLHASAAGRPIYAAAGFVPKTTMMDMVW